VSFSASIAGSKQPPFTGGGQTLTMPAAPIWAAIGDSYSSGHHQDADEPTCTNGIPVISQLCPPQTLALNDLAFSWVGRAIDRLNTNVPSRWQYLPMFEARSGLTTTQVIESQSLARATQAIAAVGPTWSIISFTGGADDSEFAQALVDFYLTASHVVTQLRPWAVKKAADCPDTEALFNRVLSRETAISNNLNTFLDKGRAASHSVRFIDMLYPHVLNKTNICEPDREVPDQSNPGATITRHGAGSVVDELDRFHLNLLGPDVIHIDPRALFGPSPLTKIQQTRYYGYPHPNDAGQAKMAAAAYKAL
jgi:hypothetical protein